MQAQDNALTDIRKIFLNKEIEKRMIEILKSSGCID
jgi:hypothetical protein